MHVDYLPSLTYLLTKLVNLGVFPPSPPTARSQPSFFQATLPEIQSRLAEEDSTAYSNYWAQIFREFSSAFTLQSVLASLFASLPDVVAGIDASPSRRASVKRSAVLLRGVLGPLAADDVEIWETVSAIVFPREWNEGFGRVFVCWIAGAGKSQIDQKGTQIF